MNPTETLSLASRALEAFNTADWETFRELSHEDVVYVESGTGRPIEAFGTNGLLAVVNRALEFKYPGKYPPSLDPKDLGYRPLTAPPPARPRPPGPR